MASDNTSLKSVGPIAAQLKQKLSSLEKTQINAVRNIGSSLSPTAGVITGDVSGTVSRVNNRQKSMMEIGTNLAAKLEVAGSISKTSEQVLVPAVVSTVEEKVPLSQLFPRNPVDLNLSKNRTPDPFKESPTERIKKKKERLLGKEDLRYDGYDYPPDLTTQAAAYVELSFYRYDRPEPFGKGTVKLDTTVRLPIPENFNVFHSVRYEERDTGYLGQLAQSATAAEMGSAIKNMATGGDVDVNGMVARLSETLGSDAAGVAASAAYTTLMDSEPVLGGLAGQLSGTVPNPHPTVFFKGLDLREFQWTWKFVPRSTDEADRLDKVLRHIKQSILPPKAGTFIDYPNLVKPVIKPDGGLWGEFKKAGVKNFSINFTGEGTSAFFHNGKPVSIICAMTFQEVEAFISQTE